MGNHDFVSLLILKYWFYMVRFVSKTIITTVQYQFQLIITVMSYIPGLHAHSSPLIPVLGIRPLSLYAHHTSPSGLQTECMCSHVYVPLHS